MEKKIKRLLFLIIILILVAANIGIFVYYFGKVNQNNTNQEEKENIVNSNTTVIIDQNKVIQNVVENKISNMDEGNRIKSYYGKFIDLIQSKDYASAYNYLNDDFKANYFETLQEFSEYMSNKYPKNRIVVKYNTVERRGEIFVLGVIISDGKDKGFQEFSENIVIREISMNNFSISFSKDIRDTSGRSK